MNNIFEYLYEQRFKKGIVPTLDRVLSIYKELKLKIDTNKLITIAGTNGKGSTSAILTSILEAHNKKVCRFNSPHLYDITERFYFTDIEYIDKANLESILIKVKKVVDNYQNDHPYHFVTFFEYMLLAALVWFDSLDYDFIILEVGMGGRFDATNIIDSKFGAITTISLDHISYLGDNIEKIAYEKAGIIKKEQITVLGNIVKPAFNVIKSVIDEKSAKLVDSSNVSTDNLDLKTIKLQGKYQVFNIKTAISLSLEILKDKLDKESLKKGIKKAYWPARYEKMSENPIIIRDVAHNAEGMNALKESLEQDYKNYKKIVIFSVMKDKNYEEMLKIIDEFSDFNIFTTISMDRALSPSVLFALSNKTSLIEHKTSLVMGIAKDKVKEFGDKSVIIVTGSIFLMEELWKDIV